MEKRYQVFLSSTFDDLRDERRRVMQTLMEMDCLPAGMELFPAADEEQWAFIRRVIDDCDYYLLVIGGRYGSITPDGISYTEKEFDYAVSKGIKVVALLHEKPDEIPVDKSERDPTLRERLEAFRRKVSSDRLVRTWSRAEDLPGLVALSLAKTIKTYPAIGWVRANTVANEDLLTQLNQLRQDNDALRTALAEARPEPVPRLEGLAGLDEPLTVEGSGTGGTWTATISWAKVFGYIAPDIEMYSDEEVLQERLTSWIVWGEGNRLAGGYHLMDDYYFTTIRIQLNALGLVAIIVSESGTGEKSRKWTLTPHGERMMVQLRTVRSTKHDDSESEGPVE
jgi:Domain of unknown function (DUF4062)